MLPFICYFIYCKFSYIHWAFNDHIICAPSPLIKRWCLVKGSVKWRGKNRQITGLKYTIISQEVVLCRFIHRLFHIYRLSPIQNSDLIFNFKILADKRYYSICIFNFLPSFFCFFLFSPLLSLLINLHYAYDLFLRRSWIMSQNQFRHQVISLLVWRRLPLNLFQSVK